MKWQRLRYQREEATLAFYTRVWQTPTADRLFVEIDPETLKQVNKLWAKHFGCPIK